MGFVEAVAERASAKTVVLAAIASYVLYVAWRWTDEYIRLRRLGGEHAPRIPHKWPLAIDFIYKVVQASKVNKNLQMWRQNFAEGGSWTVETRIVGRRIIFTADPENIKAILATQFCDYGKGEPFHKEWEPFLGDSIFATDGDKWHNSRQLLRPQFIRDRVSDLDKFERHLQVLFRAMANGGPLNGENQPVDMAAGNGRVLDISDLLFRYTLDVTTDFLLGQDVKSLTTCRQEFAEAFNEVQHRQAVISRSGPLGFMVSKASYYRSLKVVDGFINRFIEQALRLAPEELATKSKSDRDYTFLHALAGFTRDRKVLRDQIMAVLLAGRDTTAATLSWTFYELGRHPDVLRRLRREILDVVGPNRTPTYDHLKSMKYLQNTMSEILRLYPAVPFNVRLALRDTTLPRGGGPRGDQPIALLKDTSVGYSTLVMQRRHDLYPSTSTTTTATSAAATGSGDSSSYPSTVPLPDPEVFSPDRWFTWQPRPWQYVPFNGGPRICIGQQFALTEMGYVLVRMLQRYDRVVSHMRDVDGGQPTLKADIVLQPGDGVRVAFWEAERKKEG